MKAILISIKPQYCELIAAGKKTIEVRKSKPKLVTPFKCYIYCTNTKTIGDFILCKSEENAKLFGYNAAKGINKGFAKKEDIQLKGKIIGEYVCDYITTDFLISDTCISVEDLERYSGNKAIYGWHITNLIIYDKPKELSEFKKINRDCWYADLGLAKRDCPECDNKACFIQRAPQSWCYVEEVKICQ